MVRALIAAAALIAALAGPALAQDVEKGAIVFKKCALCHNVGPNATNKVGPELNGLNGRRSGSVPDFNYSDANKKSDIVWNEETLRNTSRIPAPKFQVLKRSSPVSRASRRSPTCGSISSGLTPQVISRNSRMHGTGGLANSAVSSARRHFR
jgi:cytochrome c